MRVHSVNKDLLKENPTEILKSYEDIIKGLGKLPGKHHITIDDTVTQIIHPPRKVPVALSIKSENVRSYRNAR